MGMNITEIYVIECVCDNCSMVSEPEETCDAIDLYSEKDLIKEFEFDQQGWFVKHNHIFCCEECAQEFRIPDH